MGPSLGLSFWFPRHEVVKCWWHGGMESCLLRQGTGVVLWNNPGGHRAHMGVHESRGENMLYQRNLTEEYVSRLEMRRIWTLFFFRELKTSDFEMAALLTVPVTKWRHFYAELFWDGDEETVLGWSTLIPWRVKFVRNSLKSNEDLYCF